MSRLLPRVDSLEQLRASPRDEVTFMPAIQAICLEHGLPTGAIRKYPGGSCVVFAIGSFYVVKLFEPLFHEAAYAERTMLTYLEGKLSVPTPAFYAAGELEGWRYVVMSQLRGSLLSDAWAEIPRERRIGLCASLAAAVAELHRLPLPPARWGPAWPDFVTGQVDGCMAQQEKNGLATRWLDQIPDFIAAQDLTAIVDARPALLHTEIMREHVLVERVEEDWELTGIFDFEPARIGAPEYDVSSVGVFLAGGDPEIFRAYLLAYGYEPADLTEDIQRRFLLYALLHRYSNLRWYLERVPPRTAVTLDELAREWYPV